MASYLPKPTKRRLSSPIKTKLGSTTSMKGIHQSRSELFSDHRDPKSGRLADREQVKISGVVALISFAILTMVLACPVRSQVPGRDPSFRRTNQGWEKVEGENWVESGGSVAKPAKPANFFTVAWPFSTAISIGCFCYLMLSCGPSWRKMARKIGNFNANLKGVELNHN